MKKIAINLSKIILSVGLIPLWFIKIFHGVGHLPSQSNPNVIEQVDFYHSMFENISDMDCVFLAYISFALIAVSVVTSIFSLIFKSNKKISIVSHIIFVITLLSFLIFLLIASTVGRGY